MDPIPVTLLTGFLGSGKTTLLNRLLRDPRFADAAVIVNEFGDIGVDGHLVRHSQENLVTMTTGCLCCTIRGDLRRTLYDLLVKRLQGKVPRFNRVIVETTGLADPAPVINTLITPMELAQNTVLETVIAVVDAVNGASTLDLHPEALKQAAVADYIIVTKTDMLEDRAIPSALLNRLRDLNPGTRLLDGNDPGLDLDDLFSHALYDPLTKTVDVQGWLNAEAYEAKRHDHHHHGKVDGHGHHHQGHDHDHHHGHDHHHDTNRHGDGIHAHALVLDRPLSRLAFLTAMQLIAANQGPQILRLKGIIALAEDPDRPRVIHGVQHITHEPVILPGWPEGMDRRSRLVIITRDIAPGFLQTFFDAWGALGDDQSARTLGPAGASPAPG